MADIRQPTFGEPVLFVQYQRALPLGLVVVAGPGYRARVINWTRLDARLRLLLPGGSSSSIEGVIEFSHGYMLSSEELFGFDSVTTEFLQLRVLQNYMSVMLKDVSSAELVGSVMVPLSVRREPKRATVKIRLLDESLRDADLLEEIERAEMSEQLVWRFQGNHEGYVVVPARYLLRPGEETEAILITYVETVPELGELSLFRFRGTTPASNVEVPVGQMLVSHVW